MAPFANASDWEATDWLVDVADVYEKLGEPDRALHILETAAEMVGAVCQDRNQIKGRIALKFASLSRLDRAKEVAETITSPLIRESTFKRLHLLSSRQ